MQHGKVMRESLWMQEMNISQSCHHRQNDAFN